MDKETTRFGFYCPNTKRFYIAPNRESYEEIMKLINFEVKPKSEHKNT